MQTLGGYLASNISNKEKIVMTKYFKLKEVPKKDIKNGLIAQFDKSTMFTTAYATTDIKKGQVKYSLPDVGKDRKVIAIYQLIKKIK